MNSANKVIICFLGFEYIFPFLLNPVVENPSYYYHNSPQFQSKLIVFLIFAISSCFFFNKKAKAFQKPKVNKKVLNNILIINLCLIIFYFSNDLGGSRYFGSLSNQDNFSFIKGLAVILYEITSVNLLLLIWAFIVLQGQKLLITKLISGQALLCISGLNAGLTFLYPVYENFKSKPKINKKETGYSKQKKLILLACIGIIFFGTGLFFKKKSFYESDLKNYFSINYLVDRFSTHLYHASNIIALQVGENKKELDNIKSIFWKSMTHRFDIICQRNINVQDKNKSINGYFNFKFFNRHYGKPPPGGSSIGFFATICLFLPFPLSIFISFIFFLVLKNVLTLIFKNLPFCNWPMACAFAYGPLRLFTDDPLLLFNPFESLLISFVVFVFIFKKLYIFKKTNVSY